MYPITSRFLQQESFRSKPHLGIDFKLENGTPLRSIQDGVVERVVDYGNVNLGKGVFVKWQDGKIAIYGHMKSIVVSEGDKVRVGDLLGYSGNTGHVVGKNGGYHLHFALKENGQFIDPSPYIDAIQNMNNPSFFAKTQHISDTVTLNGTQFIQMLSDTFSSIKFQFINTFIREINNNPFFLQIMKQTLQLITGHSSLLYNIIWSIL
jgi:hypothetical protein